MGLSILVPILVALIVVMILVYALKLLFGMFNTPAPLQNLVFLLVALINHLGVL